jgi:hypothetical protein
LASERNVHQSLVNNLNHMFLIKLAKIVCICKIRWIVKDGTKPRAPRGNFWVLSCGLKIYGLLC